jgi:hypothetical protein
MPPLARKIALVVHVACSVGWLGAVVAFFALAAVGLLRGAQVDSAHVVRGAYVACSVITWWVIVPLAFASLASGVVQALGTTWGLFRHWWVVIKLVLTVGATALLMLHTQPIDAVADAAAQAPLAPLALHDMRVQLLVDAGAAIVVLLVNTALSIIKPRGMTRYGRRHEPVTP